MTLSIMGLILALNIKTLGIATVGIMFCSASHFLLLCWVSLCWVSLNCLYVWFRYVDCRYVECAVISFFLGKIKKNSQLYTLFITIIWTRFLYDLNFPSRLVETSETGNFLSSFAPEAEIILSSDCGCLERRRDTQQNDI